MGPDPAVAAARLAVRRCLAAEPDGQVAPVVVACSGGADSLALLAATVFECRGRRPVLGVTVDHGLQEGSAAHADRVALQMAQVGADETITVRVAVEGRGLGVEAAAREARYAVLAEVAQRVGAATVLLGHTADDQAETVLLGLARGSGGRSIAGMRRGFERYRRPLLDLTRAQTEQACRAEGLDFWEDPHNTDPRFARARVRHRVMPVLEAELGPGVAATLARTADQLREDAEALDTLADAAYAEARRETGRGEAASDGPDDPDDPDDLGASPGRTVVELSVAALAEQLPALRRRVLRLAALEAGAPGGELFRVHVLAVEELVTAWRGQVEVQLPGHVRASRQGDSLVLERSPVAG